MNKPWRLDYNGSYNHMRKHFKHVIIKYLNILMKSSLEYDSKSLIEKAVKNGSGLGLVPSDNRP